MAASQHLLNTCLRALMMNCTVLDLGDASLAALGASLPHNLHCLHLKLRGCERITDAGFSALAAGFPRHLDRLILDMGGTAISDSGLAAIGENLHYLKTLDLSLIGCRNIGDPGLAALGSALLEGLVEVHLCLSDCSVGTEGVRAVIGNLPESVRTYMLSVERTLVPKNLVEVFASLKSARQWCRSNRNLPTALKPAAAADPIKPLDWKRQSLRAASPAKGARAPTEKELDASRLANRQQVLDLFQRWDLTGSGTITETEFQSVFAALDPSMQSDVISTIFRQADANHDGIIDVEEFINWLFNS
eukprot:gnl/TRDRNA2_/TRDRNA2_158379_c3_seq2.p1 gnl/TRDRNA2_/TRDRNA2_158379_c3~~gnl/TRDRNA2_/TRDRNA2_158379_c3_seq2.p1  ORF type:complete len:304 (-),score=47.78 gnl/TRDRNA2_/TRDRNA2_158379_c3_seq2:129-1040(-)